MSGEETGQQGKVPRSVPKAVWYSLLFASSTFILPSPVCVILFTPLLPVFLVLMILPFVVFGFALSSEKPASRGYRFWLAAAMIAGAAVGLPFWFAVVKSIIGGRFL